MTAPTTKVVGGAPSTGGTHGSPRSERGDTLVEVLLALIVLSLTVVALLAAFATAVTASAEHRNLAVGDTWLRTVSESVISSFQQGTSTIDKCASVSSGNYTTELAGPLAVPPSSGYSATVSSVAYFNLQSFDPAATCVDGFPQQLTITVAGHSGSWSEDVVVQGSAQIACGTVSPALTVTAVNQALSYTGSHAALDTSYVSCLRGNDAATVTSATYTYAGTGSTSYGPSTTPPTNVGTYSVTPSAATVNFTSGQSSNYPPPYIYVAGSLTIFQAILNVTANNQTLAFTGSPAVADTSVVVGLFGGDTATVTSATYTYVGTGSTSYGPSTTPPTNKGNYRVTPSSATVNITSGSPSNYSSTYGYAAGTLTIAGVYLGQTSAPLSSGNHYYQIDTTSSGSSTATINTITPATAETLISLTFNLSASDTRSVSVTVDIVTGQFVNSTPLACSLPVGTTTCTVTTSVTVPVGSSVNVLIQRGNGIGPNPPTASWAVLYTQP
jgi:hypothetical protein